MAVDHHLLDHTDEEEEEDYIDMEVSSISNLFFYPKSTSPKHTNEFEFQMFSSFLDNETTSPADELFYKGKLLPLHLPPRLQMFEKLLQNSSPYHNTTQSFEDEHFNTSFTTTAYATPADNTPYDSCNISPCESPKVSKELRPDEYTVGFKCENTKKSWAKKLKLGLKFKASHAYLKSFFYKSNGSDSSPTGENWNELAPKTAKATPIKTPFGQIHREKYQKSSIVSKSFKTDKTVRIFHHRRSFSGAIRRFSKTKSSSLESSSSSSSIANTNRLSDSFECSIQGAIAHCKRSQEEFRLRKTVSEVGLYTLSTSGLLACEIQDRPVLCRG